MPTAKTVIRCYDLLDAALAGDVHDFTDGMYDGSRTRPYAEAQARQAEWLLDQVGCRSGSHILDIGCGNGRILAAAKRRGADAVGITVSKRQVARNMARGLTAYLMDYRELPHEWGGRFDGIVANGSIEHFVQVEDAVAGRQDEIYVRMFETFRHMLKPRGLLATTVIHFQKSVDPKEIAKGSGRYRRGDDRYHFTQVLLEDFGGWYPLGDQLVEDARGMFVREQHYDGTEDYHWTSEYWLTRMKHETSRNPKVWFALAGKLIPHPKATMSMLDDLIFSQSWMWQFRRQANGEIPTVLWRDVWRLV